MKLVLFTRDASTPTPGLLLDSGVVPLPRHDLEPQAEMVRLIDRFDELRPSLESAATHDDAISETEVQLLAPLPRPSKILCSTATYGGRQLD